MDKEKGPRKRSDKRGVIAKIDRDHIFGYSPLFNRHFIFYKNITVYRGSSITIFGVIVVNQWMYPDRDVKYLLFYYFNNLWKKRVLLFRQTSAILFTRNERRYNHYNQRTWLYDFGRPYLIVNHQVKLQIPCWLWYKLWSVIVRKWK